MPPVIALELLSGQSSKQILFNRTKWTHCSFFEDELVKYNPPEFYEIDVIKTRGKGKKKEYLVHYRGWPSVYDEWKKQSEMKQI